MNLPSTKKGFTLIELLVVISIIGILASLAIPAVGGAVTRGQMTGTLGNVRQLHLATTMLDQDNIAANLGGGFPGPSNTDIPSFDEWSTALQNGYLSAAEFSKLLSAPRKPVTPTNISGDTSALTLYDTNVLVGEDSSKGELVFLSTKNWDGGDAFEEEVDPYRKAGAVYINRSGEGSVIQERVLTSPGFAFPPVGTALNAE